MACPDGIVPLVDKSLSRLAVIWPTVKKNPDSPLASEAKSIVDSVIKLKLDGCLNPSQQARFERITGAKIDSGTSILCKMGIPIFCIPDVVGGVTGAARGVVDVLQWPGQRSVYGVPNAVRILLVIGGSVLLLYGLQMLSKELDVVLPGVPFVGK